MFALVVAPVDALPFQTTAMRSPFGNPTLISLSAAADSPSSLPVHRVASIAFATAKVPASGHTLVWRRRPPRRARAIAIAAIATVTNTLKSPVKSRLRNHPNTARNLLKEERSHRSIVREPSTVRAAAVENANTTTAAKFTSITRTTTSTKTKTRSRRNFLALTRKYHSRAHCLSRSASLPNDDIDGR